jgi:DNA-binding transcriptional LysR family regulator
MKLTNLRALVAAVEEGSLRSAARRLGVSQPALTKMIRELERELSTTLLLRSTTGVLATAQGMVLYERAQAADRELAHAVDQIQQLGGRMTGELTVGAVPLAVMLLVPETVRTFGREFPQIQLRLMEELYIAQLTRLRKGEVDVALGPLPDNLPPGEFTVERLMPIGMVVVVRKGNPLARAKRLQDLAEAPWIYTGARGRPATPAPCSSGTAWRHRRWGRWSIPPWACCRCCPAATGWVCCPTRSPPIRWLRPSSTSCRCRRAPCAWSCVPWRGPRWPSSPACATSWPTCTGRLTT